MNLTKMASFGTVTDIERHAGFHAAGLLTAEHTSRPINTVTSSGYSNQLWKWRKPKL